MRTLIGVVVAARARGDWLRFLAELCYPIRNGSIFSPDTYDGVTDFHLGDCQCGNCRKARSRRRWCRSRCNPACGSSALESRHRA
jgi:hypothetical protein